jgi:hypothetical protein
MTEAEWLACADPRPMLHFLGQGVTARKVRLFVVACCHRLWDGWVDGGAGIALDVADRLADTHGAPVRETVVRIPTGQAVIDCGATDPIPSVLVSAQSSGQDPGPPLNFPQPLELILESLACSRDPRLSPEWLVYQLSRAGLDQKHQAELLRDVVRGPFRPLLFRQVWRGHNGGAGARLANNIYDDRAFDLLPILADALEDAGCADADILAHCRGPGPHVRGCWVVDLLLGKS